MPNPVLAALQGLSGTIERGFEGIAQQKRTMGELGLRGARQTWEMEQYRKYQEPALGAQAKDLEAQERVNNEPWNVKSFMPGGNLQNIHFEYQMIPDMEKTLRMDIDESGYLINPQTGQPMTNREVRPYAGFLAGVVAKNLDMRERYEDLRAEGIPGMEDFKENPIPYFQAQIDTIRAAQIGANALGVDPKFFDDDKTRIQGQIDAHIGAKAKEAEAIEAEERKRKTKEMEQERGSRLAIKLAKEKAKLKGPEDISKSVMNYKRAIDQTLKKHKLSSGIVINPDGTVEIGSGKQTAYQALQKMADAGDRQAQKDLKKIDHWYAKIDKLVGVPGPQPTEYTYSPETGWSE